MAVRSEMVSCTLSNQEVAMKPSSCPQADRHTPCPDGYVAWHEWAGEMLKTHRSTRCPGCGRFEIWIPREADVDEVRSVSAYVPVPVSARGRPLCPSPCLTELEQVGPGEWECPVHREIWATLERLTSAAVDRLGGGERGRKPAS